MSRRIIVVLVALSVAVAALASTSAFGGSAATKAPTAQKKTYTIYLVAGIASDAFYLTMNKGAQAEAKKLGNVKVVFTGSRRHSRPPPRSRSSTARSRVILTRS